MFRSIKLRPFYCLMLTSALVIGGCSAENSSQRYDPGTPEELLEAEGDWKLVEEKRSASPIQKHMDSRGQVSPTQLSKSKNYTEAAKSMHVKEDMHFRVLRLERQMDGVRTDLDQIIPKIASLPDVPPKKPAFKQEPKVAAKSAPRVAPKTLSKKASVGGPSRVVGVRTGIHPGKVRFVLDVTQAPRFTYDLDNGEGLLLLEMPGIGWNAAVQKTLGNNPLVKSYQAQVDGATTRLAIELRKPVKVGMAKAFKPNHVHGHRVVIDLIAE